MFRICHCLAGLLKKHHRIDWVGMAENDVIGLERGGANPKVTFNMYCMHDVVVGIVIIICLFIIMTT